MTLSFYLQSEMEWVMRKIGICWIDIVLLCVRLNLFSSGASSQDHPTSQYVALSTIYSKVTHVFIFEQIFSRLSSRPSSSRSFSHPTRMSEVVKLSVSAKALKILVKHVLANSRQMHQFCTYMQNCYKKEELLPTKRKKIADNIFMYINTSNENWQQKKKKCPLSV